MPSPRAGAWCLCAPRLRTEHQAPARGKHHPALALGACVPRAAHTSTKRQRGGNTTPRSRLGLVCPALTHTSPKRQARGKRHPALALGAFVPRAAHISPKRQRGRNTTPRWRTQAPSAGAGETPPRARAWGLCAPRWRTQAPSASAGETHPALALGACVRDPLARTLGTSMDGGEEPCYNHPHRYSPLRSPNGRSAGQRIVQIRQGFPPGSVTRAHFFKRSRCN